MIKIALADDHKLLRNALAKLINTFEGCEVVFEADNGKEFCEHIKKEIPNLAIIDYNMPEMNGLECANWMKKHYPTVPILMLTMYDTELMLIKLLQAGVKGFMKKDIHPNELQKAIQSVITDGFYYSVHTSAKLAGFFTERESIPLWDKILTEQDLVFLKLVCSELTYKEIAIEMNMNPRTVDSLRDTMFEKLDVKSRVGLTMYAIKHGLVII
ncbi:MAG: response regulator transcription factor [Chitinophagaceae bacterium]|nr:response regulator transcription factor [Chitinophagaceae bacterium]